MSRLLVAHVDVSGGIVGGEEGEELRACYATRVLAGAAQYAQDLRAADILRRRDVLQVVRTPIKHVTIEVIYFSTCRPYADPCSRHQSVTCLVVVLPHERVTRVTYLGVLWRFESWFYLPQPEPRE